MADPALPPELAERIAALDATIAECKANIEHCHGVIERSQEQSRSARAVKEAYLDAARLLTRPAPAPQPDAPARVRHDVRGAVLGVIRVHDAGAGTSEPNLVSITGLPAASVHAYLLRAVKAGEIVREGEMYRLPAPVTAPAEQQEAADG